MPVKMNGFLGNGYSNQLVPSRDFIVLVPHGGWESNICNSHSVRLMQLGFKSRYFGFKPSAQANA